MGAKFSIIPAGCLFDKDIIPQQIRILAIISFYGGSKEGGCYPSLKRLADDIGISRRQLINHINVLSKAGYLTKSHRTRRDGGQTSNHYRVNVDISTEVLDGEAQEHTPTNTGLTGGCEAELHTHILNYTKKELDKKINNKKVDKITLQGWEERVGSPLCMNQMRKWIRDKRLDENKVSGLIEEFRERMIAGGNLYADFVSAFQVYLRSGYLRLRLEDIQLAEDKSSVVIHERGLSL